MRGMLPPGITTRPSQPNIDFMKGNADLFQRAMQPGASTRQRGRRRHSGARRTSDEALPMPAERAPCCRRRSSRDSAASMRSSAAWTARSAACRPRSRRARKAAALQDAYYGNPGDSGLEAHAAEGAILDRLDDSELESCGMELTWATVVLHRVRGGRRRVARSLEPFTEEQMERVEQVPRHPRRQGGRCERAVNADAARKTDARAAAIPRCDVATVRRPRRDAAHLHRETRSHREGSARGERARREREARAAAARGRVAAAPERRDAIHRHLRGRATSPTEKMRAETAAAIGAARLARRLADSRVGADAIAVKEGIDIVTGADIACEDAIRTELALRFPDYPVVGEERGGEPPGRAAVLARRSDLRHPLLCVRRPALLHEHRARRARRGYGRGHRRRPQQRGALRRERRRLAHHRRRRNGHGAFEPAHGRQRQRGGRARARVRATGPANRSERRE